MRNILFVLSFLFWTQQAFSDGKMIGFVGISGSGKSTLARELGVLMEADVFSETEEEQWPHWIRSVHPYSEFSSYVTFRALRVDALWKAKEKADRGEVAIVDSYYDKITSYYLGRPGMEWLISSSDPYYPVVKMLTELDTENLPNVDLLVFLDVDISTWMRFLEKRGRIRDQIDGFQQSYQMYRSYVKEAAQRLQSEKNIPVVIFKPEFGDPAMEARRLYKLLQEVEGVN